MYFDLRKAAVCLAWILAFAYSFAPFDFVPAQSHLATTFTLGEPLNLPRLVDLALHMLGFAACGAADRFGSESGARVALPILVRGLLLCLGIELGQAFAMSRHAELADLVVNMAGLSLGHVGIPVVGRLWSNASAVTVPKPLFHRRMRLILPGMWALFWSSLLLMPSRFVALDGWDRGYSLRIGNAGNQERPWRGEIQYVAIYDRRLQPDQVRRSLDSPPDGGGGTSARLSMGLLLAYDFTQAARLEIEPQGPVSDPSLRIRLPPGLRWNGGNPAALALDENIQLASAAPAELLTKLIASTDAFSIEVWCRMGDLSENGEATILGISDSVWRGNVMLGQDGRDLYFRVRNRLSGPNGSKFELRSPDASSSDLLQIVATYDHGVSSMFRSGQRLSPTVDLREPSVLLGLGTEPTSRFVTAMLSVLSLLLLSSASLQRRATALDLLRFLVLGYSCLLAPLLFSALFAFRPAMSLYVWFLPGLIVSLLLVLRSDRH